MADWFARPSNHVLVIYLRNDLKSEDALALFRRVCLDHGLRITDDSAANGQLMAECIGGQVEMELMARAGRHPVNGNMLIIEYNRYIGQKVAYAIAGVVLVVVVVVAVALIASAVKDSDFSKDVGHCCSRASHGALHATAEIMSGMAEGLARGAAYGMIDTAVYNPPPRIDVQTIIINHSADCTPAHAFSDRAEFFDYFYENTKRFFFNCGLIRLPNRDPLSAKAIPLNGVVRQHK
ncbi:hypothetical protein PTSG_05671 [Salpingoeca rosetta]|uniref:Uncharacterized protein n=1 Tax=Salpingoeca rosetta (strain ATCC 50818 / BSB-021) TaxID=946362 RepID=F2UBW1_SALR5|nr:uncharacterized protein PTSG_05671 [Salpingoeca rosetta]EGD73977.1 hypothetical protein PTSG_05671 [Salpingoeca rosetta]|eukprot:XP_004993540.1 hypothetical protein PTSG_05671 [Salpingoeca rosetta]